MKIKVDGLTSMTIHQPIIWCSSDIEQLIGLFLIVLLFYF